MHPAKQFSHIVPHHYFENKGSLPDYTAQIYNMVP